MKKKTEIGNKEGEGKNEKRKLGLKEKFLVTVFYFTEGKKKVARNPC